MAIFVPPSGAPLNLQDELERLRGVVADMEALARGEHPGHALLADAPILDGWALGSRTVPCLTGVVAGHSKIGTGRLVMTSELWILAPPYGYARSLSRIYRLGRPSTRNGRSDA
ncbi:DUF6634 family protein [Antarcticirhabdus aurantiaca]|uniref:Uncharacterized protein n=1 Tax=Antarcticirhabdus aurantiaca TaxID=2606717 RepID=A0ACD4NRI1_9HYPH|nr:hypothetical protein OXU80_04685 [Jeongeuplla avenae]